MNSFALADCSSVEAALSQLLDRMKNGTDAPTRLVNIRNIPELRGIQSTPQGLTIGALTTLAETAEDPSIRSAYTVLSDACGHAATPHIRNMATLGGNLLQQLQCWY
jgi:xanthine dehydrogenase YagS FAD-binding subunit